MISIQELVGKTPHFLQYINLVLYNRICWKDKNEGVLIN
jgi:hypothetical protein